MMINTSGAHIPDLFTMFCISSFDISSSPNAFSTKYIATKNAVNTTNDITSFSIDFFASFDSALIVSLLYSYILYNFFCFFMMFLQ